MNLRAGILNSIIVATFILVTSAIAVLTFPFPDVSYVRGIEQREPAPLPSIFLLQSGHFKEWCHQFESFFDDRLFCRWKMISARNFLRYKIFHTSGTSDVIAGKSDWLFYSGESCLDDYRRLYPFTQEDLQSWAESLQRRQDWLAKRKIKFLLVLVPEKHTIYPDQFPANQFQILRPSRLDQLVNYLRTNTTVNLIDLRPTLLQAQRERYIYYRADSHWNGFGAKAAVLAIAAKIAQYFPAITKAPYQDLQPQVYEHQAGDLARMLALGQLFPNHIVECQIQAPSIKLTKNFPRNKSNNLFLKTLISEQEKYSFLPKALLMGDSFLNYMQPFLSCYFSQAVFSLISDPGLFAIEQCKPDIVINEMAERRLYQDVPLIPLEACPLVTTGNIKINRTPYLYSLDTIDGQIIESPDKVLNVNAAKDPIFISGWALDQFAKKPTGTVNFIVDDHYEIPAIYGTERIDVAKNCALPACAKTGYHLSLNIDPLDSKVHKLKIKIFSADKHSYYLSPNIASFRISPDA